MTDKRKAEEGAMAPWFEAARADAPAPSGDWLARMERLALDEMPSPRPDPAAEAAPEPVTEEAPEDATETSPDTVTEPTAEVESEPAAPENDNEGDDTPAEETTGPIS